MQLKQQFYRQLQRFTERQQKKFRCEYIEI